MGPALKADAMADVGNEMDRAAATLLERLSREESRPADSAPTTLAGGIIRAGSALEALLREVITLTAAEHGSTVESLTGRSSGLRRAPAGALVQFLQSYFRGRGSAAPAAARVIIDDLLSKDSAIAGFIAVRNEITHESADAGLARAQVSRLRRLIETFRSAAHARGNT